LITGGAGFIGRYLTKSLFAKHNLKIYDNFSSSTKKDICGISDKIKIIDGDILDYNRLVLESKNYDCMIHLAAKSSVSESIRNPKLVNKVNIDGTLNVLNACVKNDIKKILFASSAAVYGDSSILPISEDSEKNPLSVYGTSKLICENSIKNYSATYEINSCMLRIFNVYGKGQNKNYAGVISKFIENILQDKPVVVYGDGMQTRDYISVYDVIEAFNCAINFIDKMHGESLNIATGIPTTIKELVNIFSKNREKNIQITYEKKKEYDIRYSYADIQKTKQIIGFDAKITLEEGLKELFHN